MSLDAPKSDAELLAMLAEKQGRVGYVRVVGTPPDPPTTLTTTHKPGDPMVWMPSPEWPIVLRIPWSCLVSDNAKMRAARRGDKATIVLTPEYRAARSRIIAMLTDVMGDRPPYRGPLALVARVWVPNNNRRDVVNFSKALHDAMTGGVFVDDSQLHDVRWIRAGVDVDAPRCELTVTPL